MQSGPLEAFSNAESDFLKPLSLHKSKRGVHNLC